MRFLVVTTSREAMPMDMVLPSMQAMRGWVAEHRASGKLEQAWSFAGLQGGGGVANVETHEELDAMMATFPFANTSSIQVYALADLDASLDTNIGAIEAMMAPAGG